MEIYTSYTSECRVSHDNVCKSYYIDDTRQILYAEREIDILKILRNIDGFPRVRKFYFGC